MLIFYDYANDNLIVMMLLMLINEHAKC